ncbi:MAG: hypothetical protein AB7F89_01760 [Pirellulaceae bacterium]
MNNRRALAALERLATQPSGRIGAHATSVLTELQTTDEDRAVAALRAAGVFMHCDRQGVVRLVQVGHDSQVIQLNYLTRLHSVNLNGPDITDASIESLSRGKHERLSLSLSRTSVTEFGLKNLQKIAGLNSLSLIGQFSADSLLALKHVEKLRVLSVGFRVGERELQSLRGVSQLEQVHLSDVQLSRQVVDMMNQLDKLQRASLAIPQADDEKLALIGQLSVPLHLTIMGLANVTTAGWKSLGGAKLRSLSLSRSPITDADLAHLGAARTLEMLMIHDAPISDAGLQHLRQLTSLRFLAIHNTKVTDTGVANLRQAIPNLRHVLH